MLAWGARLQRGPAPGLTSAPPRQRQQSLAYPATAGSSDLTRPCQTTQWKTDSERIKKVSQVKFFIYDSEGTSKFQRVTRSLGPGHQPCTGPVEKL